AIVTTIGPTKLQMAVNPLIISSDGVERVVAEETQADHTAAVVASISCIVLLIVSVILGLWMMSRHQRKLMAAKEQAVGIDVIEDSMSVQMSPLSMTARSPISPMSPERLTGRFPRAEGAQPGNDATELFPQLENFKNEDVEPSTHFTVDCSKSAGMCCIGPQA
ncbi:unnamed protein product, partial [Effrenium voratum]